MKKTEWLENEEAEWISIAKKGSEGEKEVLRRIEALLSRHPDNIWVFIRCIRFSSKIGRLDTIMTKLRYVQWRQDERGEAELKREFRRILASIDNKRDKELALRHLGNIDFLRSLVLERTAVDVYMSGQPRKAAILFEMANKDNDLDSTAITVWTQLAGQLSVLEQRMHLSRITEIVRSEERVNLFSAAMTLSIMCSGIELVRDYFAHPILGLLNRWEYLLWFNRTPLHIQDELAFQREIDKLVSIKEKEKDYRWLFQYGLILQRKGFIEEAIKTFLCVCRQDPGLGQLAQPLEKTLRRWESRRPHWSSVEISRSEPSTVAISRENRAVCIFFSGWNGALGHIPDWLLIAELKEAGFGVVILRDRKQGWFMTENGGVDREWEQKIQMLKSQCITEHKELVFVGSSITGLTAMEYALKVRPKGIVSFASPFKSAQQNNRVDQSWTTKRGRKEDLRQHLFERTFLETEACLQQLEKDCISLYYIYGEENMRDADNARIYGRHQNCHVICVPGVKTHAVSSYSINTGVLFDVLERIMGGTER